jgi:hypothetical protein
MGKSIKPKDTWSGEDRFGRTEDNEWSGLTLNDIIGKTFGGGYRITTST